MTAIVEFVIFSGLLYWFFTSSRVADMLEVMSAHVSRACGLGGDERADASQLRRLANKRTRGNNYDMRTSIETDKLNRNTALYKSKEATVVLPPIPPALPPTGLACLRCAPQSRISYQDASMSRNPRDSAVVSVFDIGRQQYSKGGLFSRYFYDIVRVSNTKVWEVPRVFPTVLKDERYQRAIEEVTRDEMKNLEDKNGDSVDDKDYQRVRKTVEKRAYKILKDMRSTMTFSIMRLVAWACCKLFPRFSREGTWVRTSGLQSIKRASASGLPMIFVPLHRSHLDYILVTLVLLLTELRPPIVAAGDNLNIPFFGWLLRCLGAFFIRRRSEGVAINEDPIYNETLRSYILNSLEAKHYLEFFIEGGRTRTGKPQMPKAGILSVIIEAYTEGRIEDALLVPVSINYARLIDGNFVREQLGQPKAMETFWSPIQTLFKVLRTNHGAISVHYNQPLSLKELISSFKKYNYQKPPLQLEVKLPNLDKAPLKQKTHSNCSLYGNDLPQEHKAMVESIATHLVYDASNATSIMSTSLVTFVFLTELRNGADIDTLCESVDRLAGRLKQAGRHIACGGHTKDVVENAIELLDGIIDIEGNRYSIKSAKGQVEAAYYAAAIGTHYAPQSIVLTALEVLLGDKELTAIRRSALVDTSVQLCNILSAEYILCPPCVPIRDLVDTALDSLVERGILNTVQAGEGLEEQRWSRRFARTFEDDDDENEHRIEDIKYSVATDSESLSYRRSMLASLRPILECYTETMETLKQSMENVKESKSAAMKCKDIVKETLERLTDRLERRDLIFGEALSTDAIRNCLRFLKLWGIVDIYSQGKDRMVQVKSTFLRGNALDEIYKYVAKFNVQSELLNFNTN